MYELLKGFVAVLWRADCTNTARRLLNFCEYLKGCGLALVDTRLRSRARPFGIYGGSSCTGTGFSPSTSVFPCQYHSTIATYLFIHLPPILYNDFLPLLQFSPVSIIPPLLHIHSSTTTLYNVFLPVLQYSPVSIIPPLLHTHSFIYHPHCIMFFSQYFSFPLSVSFHHCSILIHLSTSHTVEFFSPRTSVFPCQYHSTIAP